MKKSKKGLSLVVVIVSVMALIIFSSIIFTASARSLSMTGISTDSRQTYLKAKSAIQYTHMLVCEKAKKNGSLTEFSVGPDGDSYKELPTSCSPDGTKCYAQCKNVSGSQWKISALVKGKNSGKMQKLNYTFTLTFNGAMSPNTFLLAGAFFDNSAQVFNSNGNLYNAPSPNSSPYPLVFKESETVCSGNVESRIPETYIMSDKCIRFTADDATWTLNTNFLYLRKKLTGTNSRQHFCLKNDLVQGNESDYQIHFSGNNSDYHGIVCFGTDNAVQFASTNQTNIAAGYYYFKDGADLLNPEDYSNGKLKRITNMVDTLSATVQVGGLSRDTTYATKAYQTNVNYLNSSTSSRGYPLVSSEDKGGIGWTSNGRLYGQIVDSNPQVDKNGKAVKDVYLNLCKANLIDLNNRPFSDPKAKALTFTAHSINFQVAGPGSNVFTTPNQPFAFQVDPLDTSNTTSVPGRLWLNVQDYNGSPWLNPSEETVLKPASSTSALYAGYPADRSKSVILVLPHGLKVEDLSGNTFELSRQFADPSKINYVDPQDPSTYTYTVPCGTNLLDVNAMKKGIKKYVSTGGPVPGGASYTITDGKYTFS